MVDWHIRIMVVLLPLGFAFLRYAWGEVGIAKWGLVTTMLGLCSNSAAVVLNGWQMPVIGAQQYIPPGLIWKVAVNPSVPWLVDRFHASWGTFSAGDVLLMVGAAFTLAISGTRLVRSLL